MERITCDQNLQYTIMYPLSNAKARASCVTYTLGINVVCGKQMSPVLYPVRNIYSEGRSRLLRIIATYAESKREVLYSDYVFFLSSTSFLLKL